MNVLRKLFNTRTILGALLFLVLVGEVTVAMGNGLFSPIGFLILFSMYFVMFHLYESIIVRFRPVNYQIWMLTFIVYSVFITGFVNKEIGNYVARPGEELITTLIRIQCAMFTIYALYLLNKFVPRKTEQVFSVKASLVMFLAFFGIMSLSGSFGLINTIQTFQIAPVHALFFILLASLAFVIIILPHPRPTYYSSKLLTVIILFWIAIGIIPSIITFMILLLSMIVVTLFLMLNPAFRNSAS